MLVKIFQLSIALIIANNHSLYIYHTKQQLAYWLTVTVVFFLIFSNTSYMYFRYSFVLNQKTLYFILQTRCQNVYVYIHVL